MALSFSVPNATGDAITTPLAHGTPRLSTKMRIASPPIAQRNETKTTKNVNSLEFQRVVVTKRQETARIR
jgi:hypothetical protein